MRAALAVAAAILVAHATVERAAIGQCENALPKNFTALPVCDGTTQSPACTSDQFWSGPWVFGLSAGKPKALPALDNAKGQLTDGPFPIRLDDRTMGELRVESRPCAASDNCAPYDCGCPLEDESYWVHVADAQKRPIARMHLWAAYRRFHVIPVDLVDGPGDELLIVRVTAHAAPPTGYDLKIWKPGAVQPVDLLRQEYKVANIFDTHPINCARWRKIVSVDPAAPKPRSISIRTEFAAVPCCRILTDTSELSLPQRLDYDAARATYVLR